MDQIQNVLYIDIYNSTFINNTGKCYNGYDVNNGIVLYDNAHSRLTVNNTLFIGGMFIYSDSTSNITVDNKTREMVIDGPNHCRKQQVVNVLISQRYVPT